MGDNTRKPTSQNTIVHHLSVVILKMVLSTATGFVFGIATEKARVFEPRAVRYQFVFKKMVMLKTSLSALSTAMFLLALLAMLPPTSRTFFRMCNKYFNRLADKGIISSVFGGLLMGIGMALAGSCPVSVFVQIGANVPNAHFTLCGAFVGTLLYGLFKNYIDKIAKPIITEASNPWLNSPFFIMAMPVAVMFGMLVVSFEILIPWTRDVDNDNPDLDLLSVKAWPPYVSGMLIGALQIPLVLGLEETLGGSSSFLTALSLVFVGPLKRLSPFIAKYRYGFGHWWQIFYVSGIIFGAYVSSNASGFIGKAVGVSAMHGFIGGALMLFGARLAGGCTSGHGITGMALLSILSVITVACMYAAGMSSAYIMHSFDTLKI